MDWLTVYGCTGWMWMWMWMWLGLEMLDEVRVGVTDMDGAGDGVDDMDVVGGRDVFEVGIGI